MKLRRILSLFCILSLLTCLFSCKEEKAEFVLPEGFEYAEEQTELVCIQMASGKCIIVELYPDTAPITVANFQKLVGQGFYDGLTFHRVVNGFMIQGGDPEGMGMGGPDWTIKGEFAANGVQNDLKHTRGVISMARSNAYNSAGSQFFIMHKAAYQLDGSYAAFGKVVLGMDTVDEIASCRVAGETPVKKPVMEKVYFVKESAPVTLEK